MRYLFILAIFLISLIVTFYNYEIKILSDAQSNLIQINEVEIKSETLKGLRIKVTNKIYVEVGRCFSTKSSNQYRMELSIIGTYKKSIFQRKINLGYSLKEFKSKITKSISRTLKTKSENIRILDVSLLAYSSGSFDFYKKEVINQKVLENKRLKNLKKNIEEKANP